MQIAFTENAPILVTNTSQSTMSPFVLVPVVWPWSPMQVWSQQFSPQSTTTTNQSLPLTYPYPNQIAHNAIVSPYAGHLFTNGNVACTNTSTITRAASRKRMATSEASTQTSCVNDDEVDFSLDVNVHRKEKRRKINRKAVDKYQHKQKSQVEQIEKTVQNLEHTNERLRSQASEMEFERDEMHEFYRIISNESFSRDKSEFCEAMIRLITLQGQAQNGQSTYSVRVYERLLEMYKFFTKALTQNEQSEIRDRVFRRFNFSYPPPNS